jgi:hypothetical protein
LSSSRRCKSTSASYARPRQTKEPFPAIDRCDKEAIMAERSAVAAAEGGSGAAPPELSGGNEIVPAGDGPRL